MCSTRECIAKRHRIYICKTSHLAGTLLNLEDAMLNNKALRVPRHLHEVTTLSQHQRDDCLSASWLRSSANSKGQKKKKKDRFVFQRLERIMNEELWLVESFVFETVVAMAAVRTQHCERTGGL